MQTTALGSESPVLAHRAGYWVLKARTPAEASVALDACPISGLIVDERLLGACDLHRFALRAPVLVLSEEARATTTADLAVIPKSASDAELTQAVLALAGSPRYPGRREVVPSPSERPSIVRDSKRARLGASSARLPSVEREAPALPSSRTP